ncbi:MAG: hypothetical protein IKU34_12110 [Clostridia bacterium]|nr:hypothetical protein [Clostridia bacterium]
MNIVFCVMLLSGVVYAATTGNLSAAQDALLSGAGEAVSLCLSLAGAYAFFGGLLAVLRESGAADALSRCLRPLLSRLLPFAPGEEKAMGDICINLSCNMLGMGSAATPAGLAAMKTMAAAGGNTGVASDAMILFFVLNSACPEILPTTMIALRAQHGAVNPADIVLPVLLSTGISAMAGIALCRLLVRGGEECA